MPAKKKIFPIVGQKKLPGLIHRAQGYDDDQGTGKQPSGQKTHKAKAKDLNR